MNKKYQIFISSTYEDLKDIRKAIQDEILKMEQFPVGMELFSASGKPPWDLIQNTIDCSDYYLLIIGLRYGSETEEGISYTQKEFEYAKSKGIPILAFIRNEEVSTLAKERENDHQKQEKLASFRQTVSDNNERTVEWWEQKDDLITKVSRSLAKAFSNSPRPGWIRADESQTIIEDAKLQELKDELSILKSRKPEIACFIQYMQKENIDNENIDEKETNGGSKLNQQFEIVRDGVSGIRLFLEPEEKSKRFMEDSLMILNDDIPEHLKPYIKEETLEKFNKRIKSKEDLEAYCNNLARHTRISMEADLLSLKICNNGNTPANNLHVFVYFPDECIIMTKSQKRKAEKIKFETVVNPLLQARNAKPGHSKYLNGFTGMFNTPGYAQPLSFGGSNFSDIDFRDLSTPAEFYIEDNCVHVTLNRLTHTLQHELSRELYAVPLAKGNFSIHVEVICDEFAETVEYDIPLEIV